MSSLVDLAKKFEAAKEAYEVAQAKAELHRREMDELARQLAEAVQSTSGNSSSGSTSKRGPRPGNDYSNNASRAELEKLILAAMTGDRGYTRGDLTKAIDVLFSRATFSSALKSLKTQGKIRQRGVRAGAAYFLS